MLYFEKNCFLGIDSFCRAKDDAASPMPAIDSQPVMQAFYIAREYKCLDIPSVRNWHRW